MFYNFQKPSFEFEINFLRELLEDVEVLFSNFEASNHFDNFRNIVFTNGSSEMELQLVAYKSKFVEPYPHLSQMCAYHGP